MGATSSISNLVDDGIQRQCAIIVSSTAKSSNILDDNRQLLPQFKINFLNPTSANKYAIDDESEENIDGSYSWDSSTPLIPQQHSKSTSVPTAGKNASSSQQNMTKEKLYPRTLKSVKSLRSLALLNHSKQELNTYISIHDMANFLPNLQSYHVPNLDKQSSIPTSTALPNMANGNMPPNAHKSNGMKTRPHAGGMKNQSSNGSSNNSSMHSRSGDKINGSGSSLLLKPVHSGGKLISPNNSFLESATPTVIVNDGPGI